MKAELEIILDLPRKWPTSPSRPEEVEDLAHAYLEAARQLRALEADVPPGYEVVRARVEHTSAINSVRLRVNAVETPRHGQERDEGKVDSAHG